MRKYSIFISIITLIFGFSFYGESVNLSLLDTEYVIAAEVLAQLRASITCVTRPTPSLSPSSNSAHCAKRSTTALPKIAIHMTM